jgi:acylphosphatase
MKLKAMIHGPRVHEVGYRSFLLNEADLLGLKGFSARNLRENDQQVVQILAEGDADRILLFREFVKTRQPKNAEISDIAFEDCKESVESITKFSFRFSTLQINKGIESILRIEKLQETMIKKQDRMIDKLEDVRQDVVVEIRSSSDAIVSEIRESRERSTLELRDSHADLKSYLDERLGKMDEDITRIKARIGM